MYELALFAGGGGGILGGYLLGWRCVGAVEIERYPRERLIDRQRDGILEWFPCWDDIRTFRADNPACAEYFEFLRSIRRHLVISGGFPCQDISAANSTGKGIDGERSGLWREYARVVREVGPAGVLVENSPMLTSRGLGRVLGDLAAVGYDARWGVLSAADAIFLAGSPRIHHLRDRIFICAYPAGEVPSQSGCEGLADRGLNAGGNCVGSSADANSNEHEQPQGRVGDIRQRANNTSEEHRSINPHSDTNGDERYGRCRNVQMGRGWSQSEIEEIVSRRCGQWGIEPGVAVLAHGVAHRLDRLKASANGQVPAVVRLAVETLLRNDYDYKKAKATESALVSPEVRGQAEGQAGSPDTAGQ